jgi:murein DD-endopeptidase MepM/ murein hydrolase activator NlpD
MFPLGVSAVTADFLEEKISEQNQKLKELEKEILQYEKDVETTAEEKQTLEGAIEGLDTSIRKVATDINFTENQIIKADYELVGLDIEIEVLEQRIVENSAAIAKSLRAINEAESETLVETLLGNERVADVWTQIDTLRQFQVVVRDELRILKNTREKLNIAHDTTKGKRNDLSSFKQQLSIQRNILDNNKATKDRLLEDTENKESEYLRILAEKKKLRDDFERELSEFESRLKFVLDPKSIPESGIGVLAWPLDSIRITQYFGNTPFATSNPQIYHGKGHNGMDLRAAVGTKIRSSASGVVLGSGNTDNACRGASHGKWVMIEHYNGLSTIYSHLSAINVATGSEVLVGDIIGYSGATGNVTGPHLHYSVVASGGGGIQTYRSRVCNASWEMPVVSIDAYLNPLSFLPE